MRRGALAIAGLVLLFAGLAQAIALTELAHGGVKGSLDLTLQPGYYSRTDGTYTNGASTAETVKGSWNCPLS